MVALWERLDPPEHVVVHQRAWDRNYLAWRMHRVGFTLEEIGLRFGRSRERIRQMEARYLRVRHLPSPVEAWLAGWKDEISQRFGWRPRVKPTLLDGRELIRRAKDVVARSREAEARRRSRAEYEERKAAEIAEILRRSEERRQEIFMGEAKAKDALEEAAAEAFQALTEGTIHVAVTAKELLMAGCAMATLGQFDFGADDPNYARQLTAYWMHVARGVENRSSIPACYHRIRAFSVLCSENETLRELIGAEKEEGSVSIPISADEVLAIMAAMPVLLREPGDPWNRLTPVKCDEEKTLQLARLYFEIGGSA